ncbi:MAG: EamA family transporter [Lactobacillus sp.]|nr:EamA family transporter [Lactobacillus sp.]
MKSRSKFTVGVILSAVASLSWGISGTTLQLISQDLKIPGPWMLSFRTFAVGAILLIIAACLYGKRIFNVFKSKESIISIISYGVIGLALNLLTFYYAVQTGNATTATILQYLAPIFIMLGNVFYKKEKPVIKDAISFFVALIGVILVSTQGDFTHLSIPMVSLLLGIGSGITAAGYVVLPKKAGEDNSPIVVLGWGTLIAAVLFNVMHPFWVGVPTITPTFVATVSTVCLLGTIVPFSMLLVANRYAPSDVISIMDAIQPISTTILSMIFFKSEVTIVEWIGIIIVIIGIYILQFNGKSKA